MNALTAAMEGVVVGLLLGAVGNACANVLYVDGQSRNPTPPYTNWASAAVTIQDAVDEARAQDEILVTDGTYVTGGRAVYGSMTNRVAVYKPIPVRSVNGPKFTLIQGYQLPLLTNGDGAIRCVYLTNGASLSGFTLTNGATLTVGTDEGQSGGGFWAASTEALVSNCIVVANSAYSRGGGAFGGFFNNCDFTANTASSGGGSADATLYSSRVDGNTARFAGGVSGGTLYNCLLVSNSAFGYYKAGGYGGGAAGSTLYSCTLAYNGVAGAGSSSGGSAGYGGGAADCLLHNCTITGNSAATNFDGYGGGASGGVLDNCAIFGNSAGLGGGGVFGATVYNCTLSGNYCATSGGGTSQCVVRNSIEFYNQAPIDPNWSGTDSDLNFCCTTPRPSTGIGNITDAPLFLDYPGGNLHLQSNSPCINSGNNAYATGAVDLGGQPRIVNGAVDIGAYEFQGPGSVISYAWLQGYGLPIDGSADYADEDHDGMNNWQEWRSGTDPTNVSSALRLRPLLLTRTNVAVVRWQSATNLIYFLERSTNLSASPSFTLLDTYIPGQTDMTTYTDTDTGGATQIFYRVGLRSP